MSMKNKICGEKTKRFIKAYWKTLMFFTLIGLIGGFFTGIYLLDSYPVQMQQQMYDQGLNDVLIVVAIIGGFVMILPDNLFCINC